MVLNKKGVSLITVLLFMMVATIAATATFKWLNSENKSSGSRMQSSEARLSALAGIEAARSWMTYHGNETGAMIKQYFATNKKPVSMNSVLYTDPNAERKFDVSVVGVESHGNTFKVKLLSEGKGRYGSSYSEVAIMKVNGLYRVATPITPEKHVAVDYNFSYFGSTTEYSGDHKSTAMLINGNWSGNPSVVENDFIITGNLELSGNNVNVGGTTCVGGNMAITNHFQTKDLYVHGNAGLPYTQKYGCWLPGGYVENGCTKNVDGKYAGTVNGDAYFEGSVTSGPTQDFVVKGNMYLGGTLTPDMGAKSARIDGNLCLGDKGKIWLESTSHPFEVGGDVVIPGHDAIYTHGDNLASYGQVLLGERTGSNLYIPDGRSYEDYAALYTARTFNEDKRWKKECTSSYSIDANHRGCAENINYFNISRWTTWGGIHHAYPSVNDKGNMYYLYYVEPGIIDVEFKEFNDAYWRTWDVDRWRDKPIAAYFVGGKQLYNFGNKVENSYHYDNTPNGKKTSPYCKPSADKFRPECNVTPWFKSNGTLHKELPAEGAVSCAKSVKDHCFDVWEEKPGCDGSKFKVDDILKTSYDKFSEFANTAACSKNIKKLEGGSTTIDALNKCYKDLKSDPDSSARRLYNGYLVVKLNYDNKTDPSGSLNGKFVFIYDEALGQQSMPSTSNGSNVLLYLAKGTTGELLQAGSGPHNYFIYTKGDIQQIQGTVWNGSMYAVAANCSKIKNINGSASLTFDKALVEEMVASGLICNVDATDCGKAVEGTVTPGDGGGTSDGWNSDGYDADYIAVGSQLDIEMESQYKNTETKRETNNLTPSLVVLPRIIYLNQDAIGKLSDYYTVSYLNGAVKTGTGTVTCPSDAPPTSGTMVSGSELLTEGKFNCTYTEGGLSSKFYVVVSGLTAETPAPRFGEPNSIKLNMSEASDNVVKLVIPGVASSAAGTFTIDISVKMQEKSGWHITNTSNVTPRSGSSGDQVYTYTGTASTSLQEIPIFNVKTDAGAQPGTVMFFLQSPENCMVGSPSVMSYSISGVATIERRGLAEYCEKYSCSDIYEQAKLIPDCDASGTWVTADGSCNAVDENEKWRCSAGNGNDEAIALRPLAYDGTYCEAFIPAENNSIVGALDDSENPDAPYILYGSLKKKPFTLHVRFDGASASGTTISLKTKNAELDSYSNERICSDHSNGCDYLIYSGQHVQITEISSADKFAYWLCSGTQCGDDPYRYSSSVEFLMDANYSYTAKFNQKDDHCFYSDFSETQVFCNSSSQEECIDKCPSSSNCAVGTGVYGTTPNWLMTYTNAGNGNWVSPTYANGYISYANNPKKGSTDNNSGYQALVLSHALAGSNGTMTARLKTNVISLSHTNSYLNNGFVLRSNATGSEYLIVNIYGVGGIITHGIGGVAYARVCYVTGQNLNNDKMCIDKPFRLAGSQTLDLLISNNTILNTSITINGNDLRVDLNYSPDDSKLSTEKIKAYAEFDLTKSPLRPLNDAAHRFAGFKLTDETFRLGDIGWKASDFDNAACFAYPNLSCSFAANYMGGYVPASPEEVKPWVGFSSWFEERNCTQEVNYFYNGCDMPSSYFENWALSLGNSGYCALVSSDGRYTNIYGDDGLKLGRNGAGGVFKFTYEGAHGTPVSGGIVRNASVSIVCENREYAASCGQFNVGTLHPCRENIALLNNAVYGSTDVSTIELASPANLRGSKLVFSAADLPLATDAIHVELVDDAGVVSLSQDISNDVKEIQMDAIANKLGFNPEKVKKIRLSGSTSYTVNSINSACPNAVGISGCSVSYNGADWEIRSTLSHSENAKKCRITSDDISLPGNLVECNRTGIFHVPDVDFYNRLNEGSASEVSYTFMVDVFDQTDATVTSTPAATCEATSSAYKKADVTKCDIPADMMEVRQGNGLPTLTYSIENCPSYGCDYSVELSDGTKMNEKDPEKIPQAGIQNKTWLPSVNNKMTNKLNVGTYYYKVTAYNGTTNKQYDVCTSPSFSVTEAIDAKATCSISGDHLSVSVTGANYGESVPVSLAANDPLGNILSFDKINVNGSETANIDLSSRGYNPGQKYVFTLTLNGNTQPCGEYTAPRNISMTCPANVTDQDPSAAISITPTNVVGCDGNSCSWRITGATEKNGNGYGNGAISFTHNSSGTQDYSLVLSRDGFNSNTCTFKVSFKETSSLAIDCPADQTDKPTGSTIEVTPASLSGCNSDCSYEILNGSTSKAQGSNYNGGQISFAGESSAGTKTYTFKVKDHLNEEKSCNFKVSYVAGTPGTCSCATYCGAGCESSIKTSGSGNGCYFFVKTSQLKVEGTYSINGTTIGDKQLCWNGVSECEANLSSRGIEAVDGGYYFKIEGSPWMSFVPTESYDPCAADEYPILNSCAPVASTIAPGQSVTITPSMSSNCNTKNGCSYSISGGTSASGTYRSGNIVFNDGSATNGSSKSYSLTISSGGNTSSACNINITYNSSAVTDVTLIYGGSLTELSAGTYHLYSNNPNSGVLRCQANSNTAVTVNGSSKTITTTRNSIDGANPRPTSYVEMVVPSGSKVYCHTDW